MKVSASQNSCDGKCCHSNGGNACFSPEASVWAVVSAIRRSEPEQEEERDQEREDAQRLGDGEAENQVAELALRRRRIANGGRQIVAENGAHADAGAAHSDAGNAGSNILCGGRIHEKTPFRGLRAVPSVARVDRIVEIDAGENGEDVGL